jgi:hypothetical protein
MCEHFVSAQMYFKRVYFTESYTSNYFGSTIGFRMLCCIENMVFKFFKYWVYIASLVAQTFLTKQKQSDFLFREKVNTIIS